MAARAPRVKTQAITYVPANRTEADEAIRVIGEQQRKRDAIQIDLNAKLADLKAAAEERAQPIAESIRELSKGVQTWAEANRAELTNNGRTKTCRLGNGELRWRMRPPSVGIRGLLAVIDALKSLGLHRFIRTKEEVDREAILSDPDAVRAVKGVSIDQGEDFVIVPFSTNLEEVR